MKEQFKCNLKFIGFFQVLGLVVVSTGHLVSFLVGEPFQLCIYPLILGLLLIVILFVIVTAPLFLRFFDN